MKFLKKNKVSTLLTDPFKTYANKLDDFMISANNKLNGVNGKKNILSYIETGLPDNIIEPGNSHSEIKSKSASKISNKISEV